jgi:hypothetical protein
VFARVCAVDGGARDFAEFSAAPNGMLIAPVLLQFGSQFCELNAISYGSGWPGDVRSFKSFLVNLGPGNVTPHQAAVPGTGMRVTRAPALPCTSSVFGICTGSSVHVAARWVLE